MINIKSISKEKLKISYYDKNNNFHESIKDKKMIIPSIDFRGDERRIRNIYTNRQYYVNEVTYFGQDSELTIPYKINKDRNGQYYYNWQLAAKLLYFQDIVNSGINFPKHMYYDIETTSLDPAEGIVTSVVFIDEKDKVSAFINDDNDEKGMLEDINNFLVDNQIMSLIGFNSKAFDDNYLDFRMRYHNIYSDVINPCNIDIMKMCNKLFVSGSLASIAKELGVIEKIELESNPIRLYENKEFDTLLEYNVRDVEVTKAICEKMEIIPFITALWNLSWCDFNRLASNSILLDSYFNKRLWEERLFVSKANLDYLGDFGGGLNYVKE